MLTVSPSRVREDAGATDLSVTASLHGKEALPTNAVIHLSLADGTATLADGDYSAATGTLIIPTGQLHGTGTFTFTPTNDAIVESDETVLLSAEALRANTDIPRDHHDHRQQPCGPEHERTERSGCWKGLKCDLYRHPIGGGRRKRERGLVREPQHGRGGGLLASQRLRHLRGGIEGGRHPDLHRRNATDDGLSEGSESFTVTLGTITSPLGLDAGDR